MFTFRTPPDGPPQSLGPLETEVLELIWQHGPMTVREVLEALPPEPKRAYTTVMTILSRLAEKSLLTREKEGNGFRYHPATDKASFEMDNAKRIFSSLFSGFGRHAIQPLVESLDNLDSKDLEKLEAQIQHLRKQRNDLD
ncbi:MAG: BlaI/MecI/CopY family transcriptional regulator [Acidobacteria bacterium]|nr:BlaI/MecI/CopY family transcriptional regulator [Acidobacteriota bacterium]MCB9399125.1 BlaI/MecI/CopY family transcriptional regulator [Acidobacteriota bacterium]